MSEFINKKINIENNKFKLSQTKSLITENLQAKILASSLAMTVFVDYLKEKGIIIEKSSLFEVFKLIEEFDICSLRTDNDIIIDIRTICANEYTQMCIPKKHFSEGIYPDLYVGIKVDKTLENAEFIGYIKSTDVSRTTGTQTYYTIEKEQLNSFKEIENTIKTLTPTRPKFIAIDHEKAENLFIPFIDGNILEENKKYLIDHLMGCKECRENFIQISKNDFELKEIKDKLLLDDDYTFRLFNGDPVLAGDEVVEIDISEEEEQNSSEIVKLEELEFSEELAEGEFTTIEEISLKEENSTENIEIPNETIVKKRQAIDWADQLTNDLKPTEKMKEQIISENTLEHQNLDNENVDMFLIDENIPVLSLNNEDLESKNLLDEEILGFNAEDSLLNESEIFLEDLPKPKEMITHQKGSFNQSQVITPVAKEDEEVENILETLKDVEFVNEEDDIDDLLSFFDHETPSIPTEPVPQQNEISFKDLNPPKNTMGIDINEESQNKQESAGDYETVLGSSAESNEDAVSDMLLYEEGKAPVEVITQEELLNIFDTDTEEYGTNKKKNKTYSKNTLINMFKDKKIVAFTAAITLSTTVLFLYLGRITNQTEIVVMKPNKNASQSQNSTNSGVEESKQALTNRDRKPLRFYTREMVKTIKKEELAKTPEITVLEKNVVKQEINLEPQEIKIKNISWELNAKIASEPKIKKYFLDIGYTLKDNLSKNLYLPEMDVKDAKINIYTEVDLNGTILRSTVYKGSGSEKVDKICLNSLSEILKKNKIPKVILEDKKIKLKLLISILGSKNIMETRNLIKEIVLKAPGVKKNQDLLEEMIDESIKRANGFLEKTSLTSSDPYLKKIVTTAVIDTIKNAAKIREAKNKDLQETNEFQEVEVKYVTDTQGQIIYELDIEIPKNEPKLEITKETTEFFKERIKKLDKQFPAQEYKRIFEMRFLREMDHKKTAEKLEMEEDKVLKTLNEIFKELNLALMN